MRNTFANTLSKTQVDYTNPGGKAALPALSPAESAAYYNQLAGLYSGYQAELSGLKQQRIGIRAGAREQHAGVRAEKLAGLASTENAAIERGMLGGTADLQARAAVEANAAAQHASIKNEKIQGLAMNRIAAQQAGTSYFSEAAALEAQKVAAQQEALAQQLQNNLIVSGMESQMNALKRIYQSFASMGSGEGGGGRGGNGGGGNSNRLTPAQRRRRRAMRAGGGYTNADMWSGGFYG
jgi:hypothetical protein